MRDTSPSVTDYLSHMRDAIERCRNYCVEVDEAAFLDDLKTQDAVIRNFEVIGEAASQLKKRFPDYAQAHPELLFPYTVGMRNVLIHGYFRVDLAKVWVTLERDLPRLSETLGRLLAELSDN